MAKTKFAIYEYPNGGNIYLGDVDGTNNFINGLYIRRDPDGMLDIQIYPLENPLNSGFEMETRAIKPKDLAERVARFGDHGKKLFVDLMAKVSSTQVDNLSDGFKDFLSENPWATNLSKLEEIKPHNEIAIR